MERRSRELRVFVFADLESSTRLWQQYPAAMEVAMARHDSILREAVERSGGQVVKSTGDGLMAIFSSAADALDGCLAAQQLLQVEPWHETGPLRVRMGLHAGEAQARDGDFYGPAVNRAARITSAAHGGQVLLSALAAELAADRLPGGATLRDLGEHRLKDLLQSERIFQLVHPALRDDFPPLVTLSRRPNNLPTQTSEFLGRESQLSTLRQALDEADVRLLTLTGPGGIGKTRLALQGAADQLDRFDDGVYFVDLSLVPDPEGVFEAVVRTAGLTGTSEDRPIDLLKQQLRDRHMLLVLDNFEQVIDAAEGVADLLRHCPGLTVLVTSREALKVRGEHLIPIPPLSLPDSGSLLSVETAAAFEAVRLFAERAREVQPDFTLTSANIDAVVAICIQLDGLPLAIELAVSRLRLFSLDDLQDRLRTRLEVLRGGARDLPARQRTLRSTIAWSYELLGDEERIIFRLLSIFAPTSVTTVEEVVSRLEELAELDVIDGLMSLVDKSLIRSIDANGRQQLAMLETMREYAAERLAEDPGFEAAARRAHAEYFADFAQERHRQLHGPQRDRVLGDLEAETGNLAKAWRYWSEAGELGRLNRLLDSLWALYDARGWYTAAVDLTNDLLFVLSSAPATAERAREEIAVRTSLARGLLAIRGYTKEAEINYQRALSLVEEVGEIPQRFPVLQSVAFFYLYTGGFDRSADIAREMLRLADEQHDAALQVDGYLMLGSSMAFVGDVASGLEHLEHAIALYDPESQRNQGQLRFGPNPGVAAYTTAAMLRWLYGFPDRGTQHAMRAVDIATRLQHPFTLAFALFHTGFLDLWRGDIERMHDRARAALEVAESHDFQIWIGLSLLLEGTALTAMGQSEEGLAKSTRGIALYQGLKTPPIFWPLVLYARATGCAFGGLPAEGLESIDQALAIVGDGFLYPEFGLLRGDLLLALDDPVGAEVSYRRVFAIAEKQGARTSQLRAGTKLLDCRQAGDQRLNELATLRRVYETFSEGFDCADLVRARAYLAGDAAPMAQ